MAEQQTPNLVHGGPQQQDAPDIVRAAIIADHVDQSEATPDPPSEELYAGVY